MRVRLGVLFVLASALLASSRVTFPDLAGAAHDPFEVAGRINVFIFVQSDCPLANRYAPELSRIASEVQSKPVDFWLVYSDRSPKLDDVRQQIRDYKLPGTPLLDPEQLLARKAEATVSPQLAIFDERGRLAYSGRIDDRIVDLGKSRPEAEEHDARDALSSVLEHRPVKHSRTRAVGCFLADVR